MKENREFDMLENADDKTVELLAEVPVLTKEEKERMLAMSKKKLDRMNRESNINLNNGDEEQVSGVDRYSRPKWKTFASLAACMVLVGGLAGTMFVIGKGGKNAKDSDVMATVTTASAVTTITTEPSTDNESDVPVSIECYNDAVNLYAAIMDIEALKSTDGVEVDMSQEKTLRISGASVSYYKVTDSRFSSLADVKKFVTDYIAEPLLSQDYAYIYEQQEDASYFREIDGELYVQANNFNKLAGYTKEDVDPVIYDIQDEFFTAKMNQNDDITIYAVKEDGKWKINNLLVYSHKEDNTSEPDYDKLIDALETLDNYECGGGAERDDSDVKEDGIYRYYRVINSDFTSSEDVRAFVESVACNEVLEKYTNLYAGPTPIFKDIDGKLYILDCGKGGLYHFAEDSYKDKDILRSVGTRIITVENDNFGVTEYVNIDIECIDGTWKLSSVIFPQDISDNGDIDYIAIANDLMNKFNELDALEAGYVPTDSDDYILGPTYDGDTKYYRVTDDTLPDLEAVKAYVNNIACGDLAEVYARTYSGDIPTFIWEEGGEQEFHLYAMKKDRRVGTNFTGNVEIGETSDDVFEFTAEFEAFGEINYMHFVGELDDDGVWKISSVSSEYAPAFD